MTHGLQNKTSFYDCLMKSDKNIVKKLAEIEREDADRCSHCGGEDCQCCEYYLDRQKWISPEEMFPYANAQNNVPDIDSDEFKEWLEYNEMTDWDVEEAYEEFYQECLSELKPDFQI